MSSYPDEDVNSEEEVIESVQTHTHHPSLDQTLAIIVIVDPNEKYNSKSK